MRCLYCSAETKDGNKYCTLEHKKQFLKKMDNDLMTYSPVFNAKPLSTKEIEMIDSFINSLSYEEKVKRGIA